MARDRRGAVGTAGKASGRQCVCIVCPRQMQTLGMVAFLEQAQPMLDEVGGRPELTAQH